jgi:hypothetical protein
MSKKSTNDHLTHELSGGEANLRAALSGFYSNLYGCLRWEGEGVRFLRINWRASGDVMAVLGIFNEDGAPMVAFGSGLTLYQALGNLNVSILKGHWRPDTYA